LFQARRIKLGFDPEGELIEFRAEENASMNDKNENSKEKRVVDGDSLTVREKTNELEVKGNKPFAARIISENIEVRAKEIVLSFDNNNLEARGGVKALLKPQIKKNQSIGFFSKENSVFVIADEMRYIDEDKRFHFNEKINEKIKIWQEKESLSAQRVIMEEETGKIQCSGGVESFFPLEPGKEKREEMIRISAERMNFEHDEKLLFYEEKTSLRIQDIRLDAKTLSVYLMEKKGKMEKMVARGEVIILKSQNEGRGKEAVYDPNKEVIVLSGSPELIDKNRGVTRGDKLTFYLADGRIVVENKEKKRSVTVIKS
jgi:lipopolysaccharide transport protein LptA